MLAVSRILPCLVLLLLCAPLGTADASRLQLLSDGEAVPETGTGLVVSRHGYADFVHLWTQRQQALNKGDNDRIDDLQRRLGRTMLDGGVQRLDAMGMALAREATREQERGNPGQADRRLALAETLAPGLPQTLEARALIELDRDPLQVHRWLFGWVRANIEYWRDHSTFLYVVGEVMWSGALVLACLILLFLILQYARYGLNLYHDAATVVPFVSSPVTSIFIGLLLVLPFTFGFGPILLFFPALFLIWPYQTTVERGLNLTSLLFVALLPWVLNIADGPLAAMDGPVPSLHVLADNPMDSRALAIVRDAVDDVDGWEARGALALALKRRGDLVAALGHLADAKQRAPDGGFGLGALYNNHGNISFAQGNIKLAHDSYVRASELLPNRVEPIFNLHRLYRHIGHSAKAEDAMRLASKIDAQKVARWNEDEDLGHNRYVVDIDIEGQSSLFPRLGSHIENGTLGPQVWSIVAGPVPTWFGLLLMAVTVGGILILQVCRSNVRVAWPCMRCGRATPIRTVDLEVTEPVCELCTQVFMLGTPIDRGRRFAHEQWVERMSTLRRLFRVLAGAIAPGASELLIGNTFRGLLFLGLTVLCWLRLFLPEGLLLDPLSAVGTDQTQGWAIALGGLYLLSLKNSWSLGGEAGR